MTTDDRTDRTDDAQHEGLEPEGEDTEGQSLHNYELARAMSRERMNEAVQHARDAARAREAKEAKRGR